MARAATISICVNVSGKALELRLDPRQTVTIPPTSEVSVYPDALLESGELVEALAGLIECGDLIVIARHTQH